MKLKKCTGCGEEKEGTEEFFFKDRNNRLRTACKICFSRQQKKRYEENKTKILERQKEYRQFRESREIKNRSNEYSKKYYQLHKERYAKNREGKKQQCYEYGKRRRELLKDKIKQQKREYYERNKHIDRAFRAKRRGVKLNATPKWLTKEHIDEMKKIYLKAKELQEKTGEKYQVDHIIPLISKKVCGLHVPWNLQPLPAKENLSKGNRF